MEPNEMRSIGPTGPKASICSHLQEHQTKSELYVCDVSVPVFWPHGGVTAKQPIKELQRLRVTRLS